MKERREGNTNKGKKGKRIQEMEKEVRVGERRKVESRKRGEKRGGVNRRHSRGWQEACREFRVEGGIVEGAMGWREWKKGGRNNRGEC